MNMYNNYLYSYYPTVHKWQPRLVNTAAISRNKVEKILGAHNKAVPINKMMP